MNTRRDIVAIIGRVAPNVALEQIRGDEDLREQLELDSMDFLDILIAIANQLGVEVPERDYAKVRTLDALVDYVEAARTGSR